MKLLGIAVLAFAVGLFAGLQFAAWAVTHQTHHEATSLGNAQRILAAVSLRALDELQAGQVDQAKSFLADQVAVYYNTIQQLDSPSEKQELLRHIESSSKTSPELRNALSKKLR